jgi:hypothetical protein
MRAFKIMVNFHCKAMCARPLRYRRRESGKVVSREFTQVTLSVVIFGFPTSAYFDFL